ncbi:MAG: DegT/DnrJ/EryC1/StrS family aminotransferase [Bryobacteraceae bacterium]
MSAGTEQSRRIPLLDLRAQHLKIRDEVLEEVARVIDSQQFILGDQVQQLEWAVANYCGTAHAVGCASGSDALLLALTAAGVQPGDRVLTTPFSFFATAGSIVHAGAVPVFADIEPATFNLDPEQVRRQAESCPEIRAVVPVHLFGGCADMDPILTLARERGWKVIEDGAQSIGAEYKGRRAQSLGDIGCLSFFPTKNLGGYGDGGMMTTGDRETAERLKALRVHGSRQKYHHEWVGWNSRLDALQAAVLRVKLRYLDEWTARRQGNAALYRELLGGTPVRCQTPAPYQTRHVYNQFVIRSERRDELKPYLESHGVGTEIYYPLPLHLQPCFACLGYREGDFPESERAAREVLALPCHPELTPEDIRRICDLIRSFPAQVAQTPKS